MGGLGPAHPQPSGHRSKAVAIGALHYPGGCSPLAAAPRWVCTEGPHKAPPPHPPPFLLLPPPGRKRQCGPPGAALLPDPPQRLRSVPAPHGERRGPKLPRSPPTPPPRCHACGTRPRQQRVMGTGTGGDGDRGEMGTWNDGHRER